MQRACQTCGCADETLGMANAIPPLSTPVSSSATATPAPFDEMLGAGRGLVRTWERINGCPNVDAHQEGQLLQATLDAADHILKLYETVAVNNVFPSTVRDSRAQNSPRSSSRYSNGVAGTQWTTQSSSMLSVPSALHALDETLLYNGAPVYLGTLRLDEEEATIVAREALRHVVLCLGEVLQDIKEDVRESASNDNACNDMVDDEKLETVTSRLLRLLGRINSATR
ncbi:hypothetical protein F4859DRAFT_375263 [Xylaria cf. heliscus]|nr:hypothetical protein F4859DRAFT_375263 [Xylaria cf. heliscus]